MELRGSIMIFSYFTSIPMSEVLEMPMLEFMLWMIELPEAGKFIGRIILSGAFGDGD